MGNRQLRAGGFSAQGYIKNAQKRDTNFNYFCQNKVKIPMVMSSITICMFLTLSNSFKLFDQNKALTDGAPMKRTQMLALNIYETFYGRTGYEGVGQAKAVVFSMVVPFQMVMFTMTSLADKFHLRNPIGMCILYLGFDAGLSVFMFAGFVKSIPLEIEEAAMIDGCTPLQTFFGVVFPILKPTAITVAILDTMHVWNDFLLSYLVIGISAKYKTIPVVVQMLVGSNGNKDMGALMAMLVLSIIPIIIFYLTCQKYIIEGVVAGAVKG